MSTVVKYDLKANVNKVSVEEIQKKKSPNRKPGISHCGKMFMPRPRQRGWIPHLFERSSKKCWNPQMDSEILEKQCLVFVLEQSRRYFQLAMIFITVACISWIIYFGARQQPSAWVAGVAWAAVLAVICILTYILTSKTNLYKKFSSYIAIAIASLLIITVILAAFFSGDLMTSVGSFFLAAEAILLLYTVMPLPLHINVVLGVTFSIAYEILYHVGTRDDPYPVDGWNIVAQVLLHICLHIIGMQICLNLQVRRRSTFWKVGQIINSNQSVNVEREFKKVMIDSIMPKSVMEKLMERGENIFKAGVKDTGQFRPLYVERMENVSILYADIVGFTKMSANKTADQLVQLLNDLFGRFDALCSLTGCEKISTLGDCYYCVAGCPDQRPDHARCCVEMGLGMIAAIRDFCADNKLNVDMRIGIHTGIVICGIVGMKRFKFDVWSNDVSFANQMEQWGVPGRIHISESTQACLAKLGDEYIIEEGRIEERAPKEVVDRGVKTYLIVRRIREDSETSSCSGESSMSSQGMEDDNQNSQDKVTIEIERPKSNGVKPGNANDIDAQGKGDVNNENNDSKVAVAHYENQTVERTANGKYDREISQPTDPLLVVKRASTHRHHHSSRYRRRDKQDGEPGRPTIKQDKIFELIGMHGFMPFLDSAVRERQDSEFVNTIKDDERMKNINSDKSLEPVSMRFKDEEIEKAYRNKYKSEVMNNDPITSFVSARFSFFLDLFIAFIVFLLVFFAALASFKTPIDQNVAWIIYFVVFFFIMLFVFLVSGSYVFNIESAPSWVKSLIKQFAGWLSRHFIGAVLLLCPAGMVFSHLWCHHLPPTCAKYLIIMGVVIIHFLNFNQLSSWMRSIIASVIAIIITCLVYVNPCVTTDEMMSGNTSTAAPIPPPRLCLWTDPRYEYEFVLDILLLMLFIFIVNKEYEVGHRLTYYSAHEAEENRHKMENERNQIDQLLHHIIPPRVTEVIRDKKMYSQNHENVAVVFASIINFNEFYEEQFMGGTECIRILNELIGDVDELLDKKKYAIVEKIKTIGSTFMIASGLNPTIEEDVENHSHLVTLMHFCMEMQDVIHEFNENMVCFNFILRMGFNHGSVTAGVIGTTKLLYDIWGDTVNIASRMDSTGMKGKIQVSEESMKCLQDRFKFQHRGSTYVKGKGQMETYLLNRPGDVNISRDNYQEKYVEY